MKEKDHTYHVCEMKHHQLLSSYLPTSDREIRKYAVLLIFMAGVRFQALQCLKNEEKLIICITRSKIYYIYQKQIYLNITSKSFYPRMQLHLF